MLLNYYRAQWATAAVAVDVWMLRFLISFLATMGNVFFIVVLKRWLSIHRELRMDRFKEGSQTRELSGPKIRGYILSNNEQRVWFVIHNRVCFLVLLLWFEFHRQRLIVMNFVLCSRTRTRTMHAGSMHDTRLHYDFMRWSSISAWWCGIGILIINSAISNTAILPCATALHLHCYKAPVAALFCMNEILLSTICTVVVSLLKQNGLEQAKGGWFGCDTQMWRKAANLVQQ
jgi:hypothetical protein